jgi:L-threonylcarbamoyladenylate synthase
MLIQPATPAAIARAVERLRDGALVALPTETVYGLGGDGLNPVAVAKIFETKERPSFDPLILHILNPEMLRQIAADASNDARTLIKRFWPGPLTLVLPRLPVVPDLVTSGLETVAVRCPSHPVMRAVLSGFGGPVAAPSANKFGRISPTSAEAVAAELGDSAGMILDGGPCTHGIESTIVDCSGKIARLLRPGAIALEELEMALGYTPVTAPRPIAQAPQAPGMLDSHYAPRTPLYRLDDVPFGATFHHDTAVLWWSQPKVETKHHEILSPDGSARMAATRLFEVLRRLDTTGVRVIYTEMPPDRQGLNLAVADRLTRASSGIARFAEGAWTETKAG